jgi:5'-3' exonuclease
VRLHLVDGTYELFRAYFGAPRVLDPRGREVGATRGLLRSLWSLLREDGVTHVACAFDHVIESFRNRLFEGYKTAEGVPADLMEQFPLAERASLALGIVVWPMVEFEADDALASAAARWADTPDVEQVLICSPDKDLAQCVRERRVVCFDRMRRRLLDEAGVVAKFGVAPAPTGSPAPRDGERSPPRPSWHATAGSAPFPRTRVNGTSRCEAPPPSPRA